MKTTSLASLAVLCGALGCSAEQDAPGGGGASPGQAGTVSVSGAGGAGGNSVGGQAQSSAGQSSAGQSNAGQSSAGQSRAGAPAGGANNGSGGAIASAGSSEAGQAGSASGGQSASGGSGGSGAGGPIKVWLAGDSTVQQCSGACPCGWGSQLDALFDDRVTVVNRAVGGRSIQTWLYEGAVTNTLGGDGECTLSSDSYDKRWRDMLDSATGMKPGDYLFVQFGINDGDRTCPRHVGVEPFKAYLGEIAKAAKDRGAQAIFVTPVSAIACSGNKATATRGFVNETKAAATAAGVPVIDLHQASISLYDSLGFCPNDDDYTKGELGAFFCNDHTHFEAAGAARIAKVVTQALTAQAPTLAAYLR